MTWPMSGACARYKGFNVHAKNTVKVDQANADIIERAERLSHRKKLGVNANANRPATPVARATQPIVSGEEMAVIIVTPGILK